MPPVCREQERFSAESRPLTAWALPAKQVNLNYQQRSPAARAGLGSPSQAAPARAGHGLCPGAAFWAGDSKPVTMAQAGASLCHLPSLWAGKSCTPGTLSWCLSPAPGFIGTGTLRHLQDTARAGCEAPGAPLVSLRRFHRIEHCDIQPCTRCSQWSGYKLPALKW